MQKTDGQDIPQNLRDWSAGRKPDKTKAKVEELCEVTGKIAARGLELGKAALGSLLKGFNGKQS